LLTLYQPKSDGISAIPNRPFLAVKGLFMGLQAGSQPKSSKMGGVKKPDS